MKSYWATLKIIKKLKIFRSPGIVNINNQIIKLYQEKGLSTLKIYVKVLYNFVSPKDWKYAKLIPDIKIQKRQIEFN